MRKKSDKIIAKNQELLSLIREVKAHHPFWGYRRIWAHLNYDLGLIVNKKRVLRLLKDNGLSPFQNQALRASRTFKAKPVPTKPNEWWGIDMTKVLVQSVGWVYITIVVDWFTREPIGWHIGLQSKSQHWLEALNMAIQSKCPNGAREMNINLMSDNGSQPTSKRFMNECLTLGIHQAFTAYNNPKGNANTERFMRTMKEEILWINEFISFDDIKSKLIAWLLKMPHSYRHSALNYKTSAEFLTIFLLQNNNLSS